MSSASPILTVEKSITRCNPWFVVSTLRIRGVLTEGLRVLVVVCLGWSVVYMFIHTRSHLNRLQAAANRRGWKLWHHAHLSHSETQIWKVGSTLFPSYVLKYITLRCVDRISSRVRVCFFQNNRHNMIIIYTVIEPGSTTNNKYNVYQYACGITLDLRLGVGGRDNQTRDYTPQGTPIPRYTAYFVFFCGAYRIVAYVRVRTC